jgi:tyrosyl-tRNA synthetase
MTLSEELTWRGFVHQTTFKDITDLDKEKRTFYFGVDANSAPSATIGNLAAMMMVKKFIKYGNTPILLVGGATGRIGDPKDDAERPDVTPEIVEANKKGIHAQYESIFGGIKLKIVDNYDWFKSIGYINFLTEVGKKMSMTQLLDRDFVRERTGKGGSGLSYAEFSYSLIQGYDFLHLSREEGATLQICASDQWGNCISGIEMIRKIDGKEAHIWSCPLIINQATGKKFGKSEEGAIWLDPKMTSIFKFYQFWLNCDDKGVGEYIKIFTEVEINQFDELMSEFKKNPASRTAQKFLAYECTKIVHGAKAADSVKKITEVLFGERNSNELSVEELNQLVVELPSSDDPDLVAFLMNVGFANSRGEARRLIEQNAVEVNGSKATLETELKPNSLVKKGKNSFAVKV